MVAAAIESTVWRRADAPSIAGTVTLVEAQRPNETFAAEHVEAAAPEPPAPDPAGMMDLCAPDDVQPPCGPGAELGVSYP